MRVGHAAAAQEGGGGFESRSLDEVLTAIGAKRGRQSTDIAIKAPAIAENGLTVPFEVTSAIARTRSIAVAATKNPFPLAALFTVEPNVQAFASLRLKLAESSDVVAVVTTESGEVYSTSTHIRVTVGGCGG
jgi:sulfur-oxidizing protein SoxY